MKTSRLFEFTIPGFASQRQWCVYIVIATSSKTNIKSVYVGKVGDNRDGCSPIITRIGNHLSHNKIVSTLRNKLVATTDFDYKIHFATFGEYTESNKQDRDKINQLERQLNILVKEKTLNDKNIKLENEYKGTGYLSLTEREYRKTLVGKKDIQLLTEMIEKAFA